MDKTRTKVEFQKFVTNWKTISERGADILRIAAAQRDGAFNYVQDILMIVAECKPYFPLITLRYTWEFDTDRKVKAELDGMYAFLGNILENNAVVLQYKEEDNDTRGQDTALSDYIRQLQSCVHMFDQDYVMKETIQAILSSSNQLSSMQHLNGFYSVWTAEPYIDDDILKGC